MEKRSLLYEGKAKKVFNTSDSQLLIVDYKDDATAFDGEKKGTIVDKGVVNNRMSNILMQELEKIGVPTHYVNEISKRETLVKKVDIIPLEVIIRNVAAGSFSKRYGVDEGVKLSAPTLEFSYKNDDLGDPLINNYHIIALDLASSDDIEIITDYAFKINEFLKNYFLKLNIRLIDFKIEFGKTADGTIILSDEISPDTCRFWDADTGEKLDKDRFRRDMGGEAEAYQEMMRRITESSNE